MDQQLNKAYRTDDTGEEGQGTPDHSKVFSFVDNTPLKGGLLREEGYQRSGSSLSAP